MGFQAGSPRGDFPALVDKGISLQFPLSPTSEQVTEFVALLVAFIKES